jgi:hypothetical protein
MSSFGYYGVQLPLRNRFILMIDLEANDAHAEQWTAVGAVVYKWETHQILERFEDYANAKAPSGNQVAFWQQNQRAYNFIKSRSKKTQRQVAAQFLEWLDHVMARYEDLLFVGDNMTYELGWLNNLLKTANKPPIQAYGKTYMRPLCLYTLQSILPAYKIVTPEDAVLHLMSSGPPHTPIHDIGKQIHVLNLLLSTLCCQK